MANEVNPILNIYNEDGTPFHDISLRKHTFSTIVMSLNDKIEGEFYYKDNSLSFTLQEYVEYKGIKYILKNPPIVVRKGMTSENSEAKGMTKYSCTFYHEMIELYNIPFTDIAISSSEESYRSEKRTFSWIGTLSMFVQKINSCLVGTKWTCKLQPTFVDDGTMSDVLSFSNQFISDVCKTAYETWKVPFVVDGYTIWFGKPSKEILDDENKPYIFKFGQGVGLKNNDCTPKNNKVITRIAGYGSNINIPYGYPIITDADGNRIEHPYTRDTLMPSVYVEAVRNKVLFGSKDPLIDYYDADSSYPTPINPLAPVFHIQEFSSIQPTIEGMTYKGQAIDLFKEVIVPEGGWDDYIDPETGEVRQSYFDVTLYPLGFDLYAQAAVTSGMTFSMKSGDTLGANYEVAVDWEDVKKNFYVTDEAGNIVFKPNGEQRDYAKYPDSTDQAITIKLTKDLDTFGTIMPSKFQQVKTGDKFVILHIEMPQAYIDKAQERLDVAMKRYMLENNMPLYDYPLSFDEHFLETNQAILAQIKPNTIVRFLYKDNEDAMELSVKEMSIQYGTNPLPTYNITLTDEVSIVLNQIGQIADGLSKLGSQVAQLQAIYGLDIVGELNKKLSRVKDDTAQGMITFLRGLKVGSFVTGSTGGIFYADTDGKSHAELDYLTVRMKAMFYALEIIKTGVIGGRQMITPGGAIECIKIEDRNDILDEEGNKTGENVWDYWRCYFYQDDGTEAIENRFRAGDMALAQDFNIKEGVYENVSNHYFWRLVVNVGTNYIDISKTDADAASDAPRVGDTICQLGNKTFVDANGVTHVEDKTRQNAIIFSAVDTFSPSMTLYAGINSYSYLNKEYVSYGVDKTTNLAYMNVYGNSYIGARDKSSYMKFDTVTGVEIKGKLVTKSGKDVEETFNSFQDQIDGVKETWYGEYTPTLTNQPAVDWNTEALKKRHEGDVFTNIQEYVDDETTPDAGKSWRWVKTGDTWGWTQIADNDTSKAYLEAAKAQKAAEEAKKEANDAKQTVTNMKDFTDEAFKDGIVDRQEAAAIEKYLNSIKSIQKSVAESYSKVYGNPLLSGTAKVELKTAYDGFNVATTELITAIDDAIADGVATSTEVALVDGRYDTFNTKYGDFIAYLNAANNFIQDKINTSAEDAKKAAEEAKKAADAAKAAADNVAGAVGDLNEYVDGAFKDGIIDISEAQSIERYINIVNNTKSEVKATFDKLYANTYLDGKAKTGLNSSYTSLNAAITNLLNSINTAIADGKATEAEKTDVNAKYSAFNTAYASFNTAVETANKAIQDKLKTFADDAKALAESAKAEAEAAKQRLDKWAEDGVISPTEKQAIKDEIVRIDADKTNITAGYTLYSLGSPTGYLNAHSNYRAVLVTLSASTPENITIPSDFASKQSAYYNQRTAALNAISDAAKAAVDTVKKDLAGYEYLKKAWKESTTIEGGVIQNALNMLGYTDPVAGFKVMSGMNGVYDATKVGGGIASWYGGSMKDRADYTEANMPSDVAKAIIRMDGSGYLASGAVWWGTDGVFHADPQSFIIKENQLGDYVSLFQIVYRSGTPKTISYMIPQYPMQKLTVSDYIEIGTTGYRIGVDSANNAIKVYKEDGSAVNFYASGAVSAKGISSGSGGGGGGLIDTVYGYSSLGGTFADSTLSDTFNAYTINKLASRITELEKNGGGGAGIAGIKVNDETYVPDANKYITLPDYPTITAAKNLETYSKITSSTAIDTLSTFAASKTSVWESDGKAAHGTIGKYDTILNVGSIVERLFQLRASKATDNLYFRGVNDSSFRTWYKVLHEGNYASALDSKYLKLSGGTLTGKLTVGDTLTSAIVATIKSSNASGTYIQFVNGTTPTVEVGYSATYGAYLYNDKLDSHPTLCLGLANNLRDAIIYRYAGVNYNVWHSGSLKPYQFTNWADTRSVNQVPNDYNGLFIMRGIKKLSTIGLSNSEGCATVWGWRGWTNSSGGQAWEIASTNEDLYTRHGETTSWTSWAKILNSSNYKDYMHDRFGTSGLIVYSSSSNEINFGGTYTANSNIYFGYTSKDNRPKPTEYHFGQNDASLHGKYFKSHIPTGTQPFQCVSTTTCTNLNADLLDGFHGSEESTANTYVRRSQNKYIFVKYINSDTEKNENHDFTQIITTDDGDNYYRKVGISFFMKRLNSYTKTIDLRSLDANKYYPISFQLAQMRSFIRIKIWNCLDGNKPTWATHAKGFSAAIEWDVTANGWGSQNNQRIIYADNYDFCDKSPCGGIEQNTKASAEIVYLRGGAIYYYSNNDNIEAIINSNGYSWTNGTSSYSAPVINDIKKRAYSCYNLSLRSFSTLYCSEIISYKLNISSTSTFAGKATFNGGLSGTLTGSLSGNASSASTATKLTNTRTIWGQNFNGTANVSGSLTGVASITASGNITAAGAITAKSSSSDIRLKKNIKEYNALAIIHKLKSVKYYWNDTAKANSPIFNDNEEHYGLIAQDLLINGYSQWVSNCFKDYYVIQYERLIPVLWRGIQQVDNEVSTLKKKIATLEKELSSVKRQLSL